MAKIHGRVTHFEITDIGGVSRDLSNFLTLVDFPATVDTAEVAAFGDSGINNPIAGAVTFTADMMVNGPATRGTF